MNWLNEMLAAAGRAGQANIGAYKMRDMTRFEGLDIAFNGDNEKASAEECRCEFNLKYYGIKYEKCAFCKRDTVKS